MRHGLFGGTFDPPHHGHLLVAVDAFEQLNLDLLVFIPTSTQPLKVGRPTASPSQRLAMVRLLAGDDRRFRVESMEVERGGLSYTVDTLVALADREPNVERLLLVGADVPPSFSQWRAPDRIAELATIVVLERAGEAPDLARMPANTRRLATRRIDVSSTEIRDRVRAGKSVRGFVPRDVAEFIAAERLYR